MENVDLKEIERRAYLTYHKDGILDIYLGMGIMTAAFVFFFDVFPAITGVVAMFPILYANSKKQYTIPRLGYVKFSSRKKGTARNSVILATLLGTVSLIAGLFVFYSTLSSGSSLIEPFIANWKITLASILLVVFSLFGYVSDLRRMYFYGIFSAILFISGIFLPIRGYVLILTVGGIISISGIVRLYRFIQEYPIEKGHKNE